MDKSKEEQEDKPIVSLDFEEKELNNNNFAEAETKYGLVGYNFPLARDGKGILGTSIMLLIMSFFIHFAIALVNRLVPTMTAYPLHYIYQGCYAMVGILVIYYLVLYVKRSSKYWERNVLWNDLRGLTGKRKILKNFNYSQKLEKARKDNDKNRVKALELIGQSRFYIFTRQKPQGLGKRREVATYFNLDIDDSKNVDIHKILDEELKVFPAMLFNIFDKKMIFAANIASRTDKGNRHILFTMGENSKTVYDKYDWEKEWEENYYWRRAYDLEHCFPYRKEGEYAGLSDPTEENQKRKTLGQSWAHTQIQAVKRAIQAEGYQTNEVTVKVGTHSAVYRSTVSAETSKINKDASQRLAEAVQRELSTLDNVVKGVTAEVSMRGIRVNLPLPNGTKKGEKEIEKIPYIDTTVPDYTQLVDKEKILREVFG